ncbi:MAG: hypothetical protein KGM24_02015, partial [Elusimicrobia bacterium]|nr:hypothetical protein [Elusimicrobiota bacterium]
GLESGSGAGRAAGRRGAPPSASPELPLFEENPVLQALKLLNPETMTPIEALQALNALKKRL